MAHSGQVAFAGKASNYDNWVVDIRVCGVYFEWVGRISRRPKRRQSTENAPGPKRRRADVTQRENASSRMSRSTSKNSMVICARPEAMQLRGVKAPIQSEMARTIKPAASQNGISTVDFTIRLRRSIPAAHRRRIRSPIPAPPTGNMEKSLCTARTIADRSLPDNPQRKHSDIALSGRVSSRDWSYYEACFVC